MRAPKMFARFFRTHYERVCDVARRNGVPASDAEDVAQEAFLAFTTLRRRYPDAPPERLLGRITKNKARNFRRTDPRRKPPPPMVMASPANPEEAMREGQGRTLMARIIRELPEELRRVYVMADIEGRELSEIAQTLGIPLGTVKSRLHAARAAIDATVQQLGRNNELPAILLPLFFGQGRASWTQKLFGCLRPLTIGTAACLIVPSVPGYLPGPDVEIVAAPDVVQAASASGRAALLVPASLGGNAVQATQTASSITLASSGEGAMEQTGSTVRARGKAHRPEQPSESDRRVLEMMQLEEVQSAYSAGNIERAAKKLDEFDQRYATPYLSRERDDLAARIRQARSRRVREP